MWKTLKAAFGSLARIGAAKGAAGGVLTGICLTLAGAGSAEAQTQTRTAAHKDWSVFESGSGDSKVCWIVTQPTGKVARNSSGQTIEVNRGQVFLMVAVRPGDNIRNEVSFLSGYPLKPDSSVRVEIGSRNWDLFTKGENAWLRPGEDDQVVQAMRRGLEATVTGQSARGNTTVDTFSLSGFTASIEQARDLCN